jgi:NhaA family Na+:H+ antiporter
MAPGLPHEVADRFTKPLARFLKIEAAAAILLLLSATVALVLANTTLSLPFLAFWETPIGVNFGDLDISRPIRSWINDGLMTFFFFVISLELKRALVRGELQNLRTAVLPVAGALGGMLIPACVYLAVLTGHAGVHGWGTVMATDTAFAIGCLALFGSRIPPALRLFLLSLAIFDDIGAILVVAVIYGNALNWQPLVLGVLGIGTIAVFARLGIRSIPMYFVLGSMVWFCIDASGVHATIAGVILGLMTPARAWVSEERFRAIFSRLPSNPSGKQWSGNKVERQALRQAGTALTESLSPLERLEMALHPWVAFGIMPFFALANAGVSVTRIDFGQPVSLAILAGLVVGKPLGVLTFSWMAVRLGLAAQPPGVNWTLLGAGAFLTGIGFTMSFFIANLAYDPTLLSAAKLGILGGSVISAAAGLIMLAWLTTHQEGRQQPRVDQFS